jgi:ATP-dependent RNA helicase DHX57
MPKNAHPPRGKTAKKTVPPEEDTSFIVFGDGKPKKKRPDASNSGTASDDIKGKGKAASAQVEDGPKKPDTRTLIAGASWTGKLPVNLLAEHFQKQHWSKPDYRIVCARSKVSRLQADLVSAKMATDTLLMPWSCPR